MGQATGAPHSVTTSYVYGQFGLIRDVFDTNSNKTELTYDIRGRRRTISDLDTGLQTDTYDAFDQLFQTVAPTGTVTMGYDPLGRRISETTTEWVSQDSTYFGLGSRAPAASVNSAITQVQTACALTWSTDDHGRPSTQTWDLPAVGSKKRLDLGYDPVVGRLQSITYPTIGTTRYEAQFTYTQSSGELASVLDGSGALLWRAEARNAERNLTLESLVTAP